MKNVHGDQFVTVEINNCAHFVKADTLDSVTHALSKRSTASVFSLSIRSDPELKEYLQANDVTLRVHLACLRAKVTTEVPLRIQVDNVHSLKVMHEEFVEVSGSVKTMVLHSTKPVVTHAMRTKRGE